MTATVRSLVQGLVQANRIMVFSKSYCPFCLKAKEVLQEVGVKNAEVLEIEERSDEQEIQDVLKDMTGVRTVPSVFVDQEYLGGGTDLERMKDGGQLQTLLREKGLINGNGQNQTTGKL
ncbi:uncharacterized protein [Diadema setosum]|uniref:uncharacterized protein n=1 Tax=Diadema setosum TaxID=31175 RepID=UPI003B3BE297